MRPPMSRFQEPLRDEPHRTYDDEDPAASPPEPPLARPERRALRPHGMAAAVLVVALVLIVVLVLAASL